MDQRNYYIVDNILKLLTNTKYDLYIQAIFHAERDSIWEKQQRWIAPKEQDTNTVESLANELIKRNAIRIVKDTKSIFKGDKKNLNKLLKEKGIEEIHIVGTETNDCILASAYEAFDYGFFTYIIEECCQSSTSNKMHEYGLKVLRQQNMTNNSCIENIKFLEVLL